jgi:hypothetical protein
MNGLKIKDSEMTNLREAAQMALDAYESRMQQIGGCSDGGCVVVKPKGMHTNGGCRCWKNERSMQRLAMAANSLTKALRAALAQPEQEKLGEIVPADEEQLERIAKLVKPEPQGGYRWREGDVPPSMTARMVSMQRCTE